jgi:hypothetical protein
MHGSLKEIHIPEETATDVKAYKPVKKQTVSSARILLQYCNLPDKNSRIISRVIWNFLCIPKCFYIYIYKTRFLLKPLTTFLETLWFRGTLIWKCFTKPYFGLVTFRSILMLSSHPLLSFPRGLLTSASALYTKVDAIPISFIRAVCLSHPKLLEVVNLILSKM